MRELAAIHPGAETRYLPTAAHVYGWTKETPAALP